MYMQIIEYVKEYIDDELINLKQQEEKYMEKSKGDYYWFRASERKLEAIAVLKQLKAYIEGLETVQK